MRRHGFQQIRYHYHVAHEEGFPFQFFSFSAFNLFSSAINLLSSLLPLSLFLLSLFASHLYHNLVAL